MVIIPAVLTSDQADLEKKIRQTETFTDYVQIDIMDGKFVPSRSITAQDLAPIKTSLDMEAHLMVKEPEKYIEDFKKAGVRKIIFHFEATDNPLRVIKKIKTSGLRVGLAINPETSLEEIDNLLDKVDGILFLSVNPGFYGSPFIPEVLDKVKKLREARPNYKIALDGGVKSHNLLEIKAAGVNFACVGSEIYRAEDPKKAFQDLQDKVK